jgi:DNA-binding response OmpR family regulator
VDKDNTVLDTLSHILQDEKYAVDTAETGKKSIEKVQTKHYDAILMDLDPWDMDRNELLRKMQEEAPESVFILMACFPYWQQEIRTIDFGKYECLLKPFSPDRLLAALKKRSKQKNR